MTDFNAYQIIDLKKKGFELSEKQIHWFIDQLMKGQIHEYQATALLMAMFLKGLNEKETSWLTDAMVYSGKRLQFSEKNIVDKHSTGGVGDKTSFIIAPIAAACGVMVPMMAGRGLGFTGGTVDKIESIPGFKTELSLEDFSKLLKKNSLVLIGQTKDIAPADRILYALRDVTATIESIPLITASIMSKKIAEGTNGLVMDIKYGDGAFMKKKIDAVKLAHSIIKTAKRFKKKSCALITNMDQPLGNYVGNRLEIIESIEVLKGNIKNDLSQLSIELAAWMIYLAGKAKSVIQAKKMAQETIDNGKALFKFKEMLEAQGGNSKVINNYDLMKPAEMIKPILSKRAGWIKAIQNERIGHLLTELGGGRKTKTDLIDHTVGFVFNKKIGDHVKKGEILLHIHYNHHQISTVQKLESEFQDKIYSYSQQKTKAPLLIYKIVK